MAQRKNLHILLQSFELTRRPALSIAVFAHGSVGGVQSLKNMTILSYASLSYTDFELGHYHL